MTWKRSRWLGVLGALAILLVSSAPPASAHVDEAGSLQLSSVPVGAYIVTVWSYPAVPLAGEFHFDVRVTDFLHNDPPRNCEVTLTAKLIQGAEGQQSVRAAPVTYGDDMVYEGRLRLNEAGSYRMTVTIHDDAGEAGRAGFNLDVESVWAYKLLTLVFGALAVPISLWLAFEGLTVWRRRSPRPVE